MTPRCGGWGGRYRWKEMALYFGPSPRPLSVCPRRSLAGSGKSAPDGLPRHLTGPGFLGGAGAALVGGGRTREVWWARGFQPRSRCSAPTQAVWELRLGSLLEKQSCVAFLFNIRMSRPRSLGCAPGSGQRGLAESPAERRAGEGRLACALRRSSGPSAGARQEAGGTGEGPCAAMGHRGAVLEVLGERA